jgi:hypothetical protein
MKAPVAVCCRKGFISPRGFGYKSSCAKQGKGIYEEMPIQRAEITRNVPEPMMGQGMGRAPPSVLQTISGSSSVPQRKDLSGLSSVLSSVSIGDRRKGARKKIKL